jgi:molybdopterin molybdotransferase
MTRDSLPPPDPDVRMRGFARRVTVEDALGWIDAHARQLAPESIVSASACGRVLAETVTSTVQVPPFARSMMDGFALQAIDTDGATPYNRLPVELIGESLPGRPFDGVVSPGQAVRIMTGAALPQGADAVLPVEKCEVEQQTVFALEAVSPAKNVGRAGEDIEIGTQVLNVGRVLRPQDVGLLASVGRAGVNVVRQPRVRIVTTGNELLTAGDAPQAWRIFDSNGPMLAALVARDGGMAINPGVLPDDPQQIAAALQDEADVVLVSGGSSVGEEDHAPRLLAEVGELAIHGIAMRPSSPAGMGRIGDKLVFLLPGNPVSCLCAYDFFAGRAIRMLGGRSAQWPYRRVALPLSRKLVSQVGRVDYARVRIAADSVEPLAISGASLLTSTVLADGFVIVPSDSEGYPPGAIVEVYLYDA